MLYKRISDKNWYPWLVTLLCMLTVVASNGLVNSGLTVFDESLLQEFSWSVSELKTRDFLSFACGSVFVLATGYIVDRYGPKSMLLLGMALLTLGYFFYGNIETLTQLYTTHIVFGMVIACAGNMTAIVTAASWVKKRRGLAVGMVIAGTSVGGMIIPPLANYLNQQIGWRLSMQWEALYPLLMLILIFLFIKNPKSDKKNKEKGHKENKELKAGMRFAEVLRQPSFYLVTVAGAFTFFSILSLFQHMFLYMRSLEFSPAHASLALSLMSLAALFGKILAGFASDHVSPYKLFRFQMVLMLVGVVGVGQLSGFIWVFLVFTGFGWGGLHTLYNYILITLFGLRDAGKINSVVSFAEAAGGSLGILFTGYLYDYFGNYPDALLVAAALMVIATACIFAVKPVKQGDNI